MKTYTLCGSMRFEKEMREIAYDLEARSGYNILQCAYCPDNCKPTDEELSKNYHGSQVPITRKLI